jgi:uncharacterized delta-60 repeat protein
MMLIAPAAFGASLLVPQSWQQTAWAQEMTGAAKRLDGNGEPETTNSLAGDLDLTFGVDGTVTSDLGNQLNDSASAVAVQPDGKVIAVGYVLTNSTGKDFAVLRLNPNGSPDATFSDDGKLGFSFNSGTRDDIARAVAVQPDGKIVVAGEADVLGSGNFDVVIARLNADGSFDASFGNNGKITTNLPNNRADFGRALALQPDGKILVIGYSNRPTSGDDFLILRYNSNGSLDTTFDGDGIVTADILTNREDRAAAVTLQVDGKIVVAGYTSDPSFKNNFAIVRYNANGSLDSSFNGTGKVTIDLNLNSDDLANAIALQGDGKILVAGRSADDFGLVRYNSDGSVDALFGGGDGVVTTNFGTGATDIGRAVVVQGNGRITIAGRSRSELAFARYNNDGTLDSSFDNDGLLVQNAGNNFISSFGGYWGMALQADGKIVAAGDGWRDGFGNDFTVSRLNANGTFDLSFGGGDGIAATDFAGRFDEARSVAVQPDGKIVMAGTAQNSTGGTDFAVARFKTNGTLDPSFDNDGLVTTDIQGHPDEAGWAVAIQPDGKILVAGNTDNALDGNVDDGALIRYNSNGTIDSTFGSGGVAILTGKYVTSGGLAWIRNRSIALQPDGKIVVAGEAHYVSVHCDGLVARYNANGILDGSFGFTVGGVSVIDYNTNDTFKSVVLQSDGKVVAAGSADNGTSALTSDFLLVRLSSNGILDSSFDGDGKVLTNFANNNFDAAYDIAVQADGKLIAVGETVTDGTGSDFGVARYNTNGSLDTSFAGGDGLANIDYFGYREYCSGVVLQPDGKIILAGFVDAQIDTGYGVIKLNQNGTFDTSFGGGTGRIRTLFGDAVGTALDPGPNDVALQANGKILVAGKIDFNSTDRDFTLVRYHNDNLACVYTLDPTSGNFSAAGGNGSVNVMASAGCEWSATSSTAWITISSAASGSGNATISFTVSPNTDGARTGVITVDGGPTLMVSQSGALPIIQFSAGSYSKPESGGSTNITVTRIGDTAGAGTVNFNTGNNSYVPCNQINGVAVQNCDFILSSGTLNFAAGQSSRSFPIIIIEDLYAEGDETINLTLSNPSNAVLGAQSTATLMIVDNDSGTPGTNPLDTAQAFVRQHYYDFLGRLPDDGGLAYWTNEIAQCGTNQACINNKRVDVSNAFFYEQEYQQTASYVFLLYRAAFGNDQPFPNPDFFDANLSPALHEETKKLPRYLSFVRDRAQVVGGSDLAQTQQALANAFVQRPEFVTKYPMSLTGPQFVASVLATILNASGVDLSSQSTTLNTHFTNGGRGLVLFHLANDYWNGCNRLPGSPAAPCVPAGFGAAVDNRAFIDAEYNRSFVYSQYSGYLRRDGDISGFIFWLNEVSKAPPRNATTQHAMVCSFITSAEYQQRLSPVVTHFNSECGP